MSSTPGNPTIRPFCADDMPAVKRVIDGTGLFPSDMLDDMAAPFLAGEAGEAFWLTLAAPDPVAIAYVAPEQMTEGTWNLLMIAVDAARQGSGLGAALVAHIEASLIERGGRILLVETSGLPSFERTRRFYARLGFGNEARIRDFYQAGEDKVIFRKALTR